MSNGRGSKRRHNKPAKNATASASTQTAPVTIRRGSTAPTEEAAAPSSALHAQAKASAPVPAPKACPPAFATPEQARARFALERIQALRDEWQEKLKEQKEFNSYASAMPFMIRANGLGQTAAFYRRKGTDHVYFRLYELLGAWLSQPERPFDGKPDLLEAITQCDQETYLVAQIEALLFLDWVKKLASAFLAREEDQTATTAATEAQP